MRPVHSFAAVAAAVLLLSGSSRADTITLWEGKSGLTPAQALAAVTNDTYLKFGDASPNGAETTFQTGPSGTIGLLSFPNILGVIPAGSTINSVVLDMCAPGATSSTAQVSMFLATNAFTESSVFTGASSGNGGVGTGATIVNAQSGLRQGHNTFDITAAFLAWQSGTPNFGLVIRTVYGTPVTFASSEHPNFTLSNNERPALTIRYTPPSPNGVPAPPSVVLLALGGLLMGARQLRCRLVRANAAA